MSHAETELHETQDVDQGSSREYAELNMSKKWNVDYAKLAYTNEHKRQNVGLWSKDVEK